MRVSEAHGFVEAACPQEWLIFHVGMQCSDEHKFHTTLANILDRQFHLNPTQAFAMARRVDTHPVDLRAHLAVVFEWELVHPMDSQGGDKIAV